MSTRKETANISKVMRFLQEWDFGNTTVRCRMLRAFLDENTGKTFWELELQFAQVASLFLCRLTTWMRLTYMFGTCFGLQLKAIGVFLSASSHDQFLMEFLQEGGALTLLDVLGQTQIKEEDKTEALRLLLTLSNAGRKYKEFICASHGMRAIAECLATSSTEETQETAWALLESLSHGNPKYQNQVYKGLIALLPCTSPKAQQLVLQTLRTVQSRMKTAHPSIVEPLLNMLRSLRLEVQEEAINLILDLRQFEVRPVLLSGLVALLKPTKEEVQQHQILEEPEKMTESPVFVQQAAAAKAIWLLAQGSQELSQELLSLRVIHHLLYALGNREHTEAQVQASLALEHFVRSFPVLEEQVHRCMGRTLFAAFMSKADTVHMNMDEIQAEILLSNKVNIMEVLGGKSNEA